jgi:hypothetical protein
VRPANPASETHVPQQVQQASAVLAIAACEPNAAVSRRLGRGLGTVRPRRKRFTPNAWPHCATGVTRLPNGTDAIIAGALAAPGGTFAVRNGIVHWQQHGAR